MKTSLQTNFADILIVALTVPLCALFAQSTSALWDFKAFDAADLR